MRKQIISTLKLLQVDMSNMGFEYIITAIELIAEDKQKYQKAFCKLYEEIANKFDTTKSRVERAMRHSIEGIFAKSNEDLLIEIFGTNQKIACSRFVYALMYYICEE